MLCAPEPVTCNVKEYPPMMYQSTRDPSHKKYTSAEVIKMGLAPDGGLFLPETIPTLSEADIETLRHESYPVRAATCICS